MLQKQPPANVAVFVADVCAAVPTNAAPVIRKNAEHAEKAEMN